MRCSLLFLACCTLTANSGCREKKKEDPRPVSTEIFGEWQWVSSIGGFTGRQETTPASTGDQLTYTFHRDSTFVSCVGSKSVPTQCLDPVVFTVRKERSLLYGDVRSVLTIQRKIYLAPPDSGFHILKDRYIINKISENFDIRQDYPSGFGMKFRRK